VCVCVCVRACVCVCFQSKRISGIKILRACVSFPYKNRIKCEYFIMISQATYCSEKRRADTTMSSSIVIVIQQFAIPRDKKNNENIERGKI
jgi:hypothetical protein